MSKRRDCSQQSESGEGAGTASASLGLAPHGGERRAATRGAPPARYCNHQPGDMPEPGSGKRAVYSCVRLAKVCTTRPNSEAKFRLSSHGSDERLALALPRYRALPCGRALYAVVTAGHQRRAHPPARRVRAHGAILTYGTNNIGASAPAKALVTHSSRLMFLPKRP